MKTTITLATLLFLISIPGQLLACSCTGQRTVQEEVKHSDAVIVGTILSKQLITLTDSTMGNSMNKMIARYDLLVQDTYKGKITSDTVTIYTGLGGGDCGIRFEVGKKYIVYGEDETYFGQTYNDYNFPKAKNAYWTYSCLRKTSYFEDEITEIEKFARKQK